MSLPKKRHCYKSSEVGICSVIWWLCITTVVWSMELQWPAGALSPIWLSLQNLSWRKHILLSLSKERCYWRPAVSFINLTALGPESCEVMSRGGRRLYEGSGKKVMSVCFSKEVKTEGATKYEIMYFFTLQWCSGKKHRF